MQCMSRFLPKEKLIVITGPSGVGKGSLVKLLLQRNQEIWLSISATTRSPRPGEVDGLDYFFLQKNRFSELVNNTGFLEWAEFAGNFYGTPRKAIEDKLAEAKLVLLEIELEGARQVRKSFPEAFQIFIRPPSLKELERRIRGRGTEEEDSIQSRLRRAKDELKAQHEFNAVVINEDLFEACLEIETLIGVNDQK